MKFRLLFTYIILFLTFNIQAQQSLDNIYTTWAQKEIPVSHQNIKAMVESIWGTEEVKTAPMIELHCKSLNVVLNEVQKPNADLVILEQALTKWSKAEANDRGENWWEWPSTNWIRVEIDYKKQMAEKNQANND